MAILAQMIRYPECVPHNLNERKAENGKIKMESQINSTLHFCYQLLLFVLIFHCAFQDW